MEKTQTVADRVYGTMREMIVSSELKPGDPLVHRQLAARLGTSNIPVVEAIRRLERDGLVICQANWTAKVKQWTIEDVEGIYLVREALEGIACRLFASRATEFERLTLKEYARQCDVFSQAGDLKRALKADIDLHLHIVKCSRSDSLYHLAENSCVIEGAIRSAYPDMMSAKADLASEASVPNASCHDELVVALTGGDPVAAEEAGRDHVRHPFERILKRWQAHRQESNGGEI